MDQVRPRLKAFAGEMLGGLARADQQATGELNLRVGFQKSGTVADQR